MAHLLCLSVFLVQLIQQIPAYISPTMTYTVVENKPLKDMEFPVDIQICIKPILNSTVLQRYGYRQPNFYPLGAVLNGDNKTLVGWGGHSQGWTA